MKPMNKLVTWQGEIWASACIFGILTACTPGQNSFELGLKAFEAENYDTAFKEWVLADIADDAGAQNGIGWLYEKGLIGTANPALAAQWYKKAAESKHDGALLNLGNLLDDGVGVEKDYEAAVKNFEEAANLGNPEAQNNLGRMYREGHGVKPDEKKVVEWLTRAAKQGYAPAQNSLGLLYFKGEGVQKDIEQAFYWLEIATRSGLDGAEHNRDFVRTFLDANDVRGIENKAARWSPWYE